MRVPLGIDTASFFASMRTAVGMSGLSKPPKSSSGDVSSPTRVGSLPLSDSISRWIPLRCSSTSFAFMRQLPSMLDNITTCKINRQRVGK
jgi:hypothetical protein